MKRLLKEYENAGMHKYRSMCITALGDGIWTRRGLEDKGWTKSPGGPAMGAGDLRRTPRSSGKIALALMKQV